MDLDDQMRRYFGTSALDTLPAAAFEAGVERMQVDLGLETDRARRFALWALLHMLGAPPALDRVFADAADRDAARDWMALTERVEDAATSARSG